MLDFIVKNGLLTFLCKVISNFTNSLWWQCKLCKLFKFLNKIQRYKLHLSDWFVFTFWSDETHSEITEIIVKWIRKKCIMMKSLILGSTDLQKHLRSINVEKKSKCSGFTATGSVIAWNQSNCLRISLSLFKYPVYYSVGQKEFAGGIYNWSICVFFFFFY